MHIDSLDIKLSGAVGIRRGTSTDPLNSQKDVIKQLHDLLIGVGWSALGIKATGTINYPFGFPTVPGVVGPGGKTVVGCGRPAVSLDGKDYVWYDPYNEIPAANAPCTFFALATTVAVSLTNLANAITGRYNASLSGPPYSITVTANDVGASFNFPLFSTEGEWGIHSEVSGGGYTFTSVEDRDANNLIRTAQYLVTVTSYGSINPGSGHITRPIWFDFQTSYNTFGSAIFGIDSWIYPGFGSEGADVDRSSFGSAGYIIVANPYSFAIFCPDGIATGIFACSPYIPTEEDFTTATAVCVVAPLMNPTKGTYWDIGYGVTLNSPMVRSYYSGTFGFPRMLAVRSPGTLPLLTPSGTPLITNAWIMFGESQSSIAYVVGKLWDCAMINDMITSEIMIGAGKYVPLGYQDGSGAETRSSLLFRVG